MEINSNLPSLCRQTLNFTTASIKHITNGLSTVTDEKFKQRIEICKQCPFYITEQYRCSKCGCFLEYKAKLNSSQCPDNPPRW